MRLPVRFARRPTLRQTATAVGTVLGVTQCASGIMAGAYREILWGLGLLFFVGVRGERDFLQKRP